MNHRSSVVTVIAVVSALGLLGSTSRAGEDDDEKPTISVSGTGKLSAIPDIAEIQVGVRSQAPTAAAALSQNNESMNALYGILKESGIATKDIQTTQIQVSPQYSQPPGRPIDNQNEFIPRIVGYRVDNTVHITARDVSKLGGLLDGLVKAGANQIHGISFRVDNSEKLMHEVRKRAVADAKSKAELLAGEAGVVLGTPLKISEEGGPRPPVPRFAGRMEMMAAAAPMPISAGEQELSVTVHIVYELKPSK